MFTEATEDSPSILFDEEQGLIEIIGKSLPEDAIVYFAPLQKMAKEYVKAPKANTRLNFKLEYLNSSSAKKILEIITLFEDLPKNGFQVEIKWIFKTDDEDMKEEGEEFQRMTSLPIVLEEEQ